MGRGHVEIVERAMRAMGRDLTRGDLDAAMRFAAPDVQLTELGEVPGAGVHRGIEEVRRYLASFVEVWQEFVVEPESIVDCDGGEVLVVARNRGRSRAGGPHTEMRVAHVWSVRDGAVVAVRVFADEAQARAAMRDRGTDSDT